MRIGIITWFNNLNFGTALQAVALQDYLKREFDAQVQLIRYLPSSENQIHSIKQKLEHLPYKLLRKAKEAIHNEYEAYNKAVENRFNDQLKSKKTHFDSFMKEISFTAPIESDNDFQKINDKFDMFICGSDQIWNPQLLDRRYFLDFAAKTKIAYAASFGVSYIPKYAEAYLKTYLSDFSAIGLREGVCLEALGSITNAHTEVVCDPTLLFEKDYWQARGNDAIVPKEKYFVTYFLGDTKLGRTAIQRITDKLKIQNIIMPSTDYALTLCEKEAVAYGPAEFISLIKNAEFVLTDSFHATCFSILFNKKFCTIKKHSQINPFRQNSRIESILSLAGIPERLADSLEDVLLLADKEIDYTAVNENIDSYRESSKRFLLKFIK